MNHRTEERALGWYRLTREVLKAPEAPSVKDKDKSSKARRPQLLIKLVMRRSLCLFNIILRLLQIIRGGKMGGLGGFMRFSTYLTRFFTSYFLFIFILLIRDIT